MPVIVDDGILVSAIPGGAGAGTVLGSRIFVLDDISDDGLWARAAAPLFADSFTLTLTYDNTLARVKAEGSGMEPFATATLERSPDGITWTTVRGGVELDVALGSVTGYDYEFVPNVVNYYRLRTLDPFGQTATGDITPAMTDVWLKSVARPFLNIIVDLSGDTFSIGRTSRGAVFDIVGRSLPVAVTDVRSSRSFPIIVRTDTAGDADALDYLLASGDLLYLHAPEGEVVPAGGLFAMAGDSEMIWPAPPDEWRMTTIPLRQIAAPGADVVGTQSTCQTVLNTYATCEEVLAAHATIADLLTLIGDASEVVVP